MIKSLLEKRCAERKLGQLNQDRTQFVQDVEVVGKTFQNGEECIARELEVPEFLRQRR